MEINTLYSKTLAASSAKVNAKSSDSSAFNKIFERTSQNNQNNQTNQTSQSKQSNQTNQTNQTRQSKSRDVQEPKSDNTDSLDNDNKPLSKEEKDVLKQAGMSDDEINSIKSEKELKETIIKKLLGGDTKENEDLNSLLAMFMTLMNGKFDNTDYSKIKDFASQNADKLINIISNCVSQEAANSDLTKSTKSEGTSDLLKLYNELQQSVNKLKPDDVAQALNSNGDSILKKLQSEFSDVLKNNLKDLNTSNSSGEVQSGIVDVLKNKLNDTGNNKKDSKDLLNNTKLEGQNIQSEKVTDVVAKTDKKSSDTNLMMGDSNSKSDEDFLKSLLSDNSNDKISKVTNFMTQFNNVKVENANMADIENLVINKSNVSADIIKTVKYMEINSMKDLTVKINPKELGEVIIKLTMEAGTMKATITASNKEAYNLINSNLLDMTNKLQNSDMKVASLALNIYNEDTTFFKDGSNNNQGNNKENKERKNHTVGQISEDDDSNKLSSIDSNVNMLA